MTESVRASRPTALPCATPISRTLRVVAGGALLAMVAGPLARANWSGRLQVAAVVVAMVVLYSLVHVLVNRRFRNLNAWFGALIAICPVVVISMLGPVFLVGVIVFLGVSLVLLALTGQPGCEVMAVPALVFRQPTHLVCILFTPLDWLEGKLRRVTQR